MMDVGPGFGVFLMMNNYFHDVATALLAASGIVLGLIVVKYEAKEDEAAREYFGRIYSGTVRLARFTLFWILLGGIPRTLYFRTFEWKNALDHHQVPALIIKHVLALSFVALGAWLWKKYSIRAAGIMGPRDK
jgi:hypothetical protein